MCNTDITSVSDDIAFSSPLHLFGLGATAILASLNPEIRHLGWYYLPVILLTSTLVLVVALITNNIHRRFPVFWIKNTSPSLVKSTTPTSSPIETLTDVEKVEKKAEETVTKIPV